MAGLLAAVAVGGWGSDKAKDAKGGSIDKPAEKVILRLGYVHGRTGHRGVT